MFRVVTIGFAILFVVGLYLFPGTNGNERRDVGFMPEDADMDVSMSGVEMRLGQEGRTLWTLKAHSAAYDQDQQVVMLDGPSIIKNISNQDMPIIVNAPLGEVDQSSNDIRLWSGVDMEYGPTTLYAREAVFIQIDETIFLFGDIQLDRQGLQLRAVKGDVDLTTWVVNAEDGVEVVIAGGDLAPGL